MKVKEFVGLYLTKKHYDTGQGHHYLAPIEAKRTAQQQLSNVLASVPDLQRIAGYAGVERSGVVVASNLSH